jgi:hypothetical protein
VRTFAINDSIHLDQEGTYRSIDAALARLRQLARQPWDAAPNRAPCSSWESCGRDWEILEYEVETIPWQLRETIPAVSISRDAVTWHSPFRAAKPFARKSRPRRAGHRPSEPRDPGDD